MAVLGGLGEPHRFSASPKSHAIRRQTSRDRLLGTRKRTAPDDSDAEDIDQEQFEHGAGTFQAPAEERRLVPWRVNRKIDLALLPLLSLLYLFNGLDRSNAGNAQTQGGLMMMT